MPKEPAALKTAGRSLEHRSNEHVSDEYPSNEHKSNEQRARLLEGRIGEVGIELREALQQLLDALPRPPRAPGELAAELALDKVLATRVMKMLRASEPLAVIHVAPGPAPLRRVVQSARRAGRVSPEHAARALAAIERFDRLIRVEAGDRSALEAMMSAWLPDSRREFELRRKQAAFRAMSELIGASVETSVATVLLHPAARAGRLDVAWLFGMLGLRRHRPGSRVRLTSRRIAGPGAPRAPRTLEGKAVHDFRGLRLDAFCSVPPPELEVHESGEVVRYTLADHGFGPNAVSDLVFAEANLDELDATVPRASGRRSYFFAEVTTPAVRLIFDVLVHREVYPGAEPTLAIYDTVLEGVASVNDPGRDLDRLHLEESIRPLGAGLDRFRATGVPRYAEILRLACSQLGWEPSAFRGYRCAIDYPIYGSQVTMIFQPPFGMKDGGE